MSIRAQAILIIVTLTLFSIVPFQASAVDLEGGSSNVTVRSKIDINSDGVVKLNFKVLWGESEFEDSNIFRPRVNPPIPWSDLSWNNLSTMVEQISTIQYLFESNLSDGKTIVHSEEHFIETVLDIDVSFFVESIEASILTEFQTIEIQARLEPSKSSYSISPLSFLADIDFNGYDPQAEVEIKTGSSITLRSSSFSLNHFLLPEGHRFYSEGLFSVEDSRVTYDTSEDSIHVRKLPPIISSSILYSIWIGAAFLSMILISVAGRRAKRRVNKGAEMWFAIGMVCFLAFLPYHLYLSLILIVIGFYYSVKKSRELNPSDDKTTSKKEETLPEKKGLSQSPSIEKDTSSGETRSAAGERPLTPIQPDELKTLIPPPLPLEKTTIQSSDPSFAPPPGSEMNGIERSDPPTTADELERDFSRPDFQDEPEE